MIRVREMSQVLRDLCMAQLLNHFRSGLCGPARLEGMTLPLARGSTAFSSCKKGITSLQTLP